MTRELVFVHGRSQQQKDSATLKGEWIDSLNTGLSKNDPPLPPVEPDLVRFPYYGDALHQMAWGKSPSDAADVILKGDPPSNLEAQRFLLNVFDEVRRAYSVDDKSIEQLAGQTFTTKGAQNWSWVRAVLQKLDSLPQLSAGTLALATFDVFQYLTNSVIRGGIDEGVARALKANVDAVVVGHSLGTVVSYTLLQREGAAKKWKVPHFVTLGSPLAVSAVRNLAPGISNVGSNRTPSCVSNWFNAMDPRDIVALHPLDEQHFPLKPAVRPIRNKVDVDNFTGNRHGIAGYLEDPDVARQIHNALRGPS